MKPRYTLLLFVVALLVVGNGFQLSAQDAMGKATQAPHPLAGTWKLNVAQSKISANDPMAPQELTIVIREVGDQFEATDTGTQKNGSPIASKWTSPLNGGVFKLLQPAPAEGESYVDTMIEPGNRYLTALKNGKQVKIEHLVLSKDGKTFRITIKGRDPKGKPFENLTLYDKQ